MNATAKALHQGTYQQVATTVLGTRFFLMTFLLIAVLASAIAIIYIKDENRQLTSHIQMLQNHRESMQVQYGQLLLEQSTLSTQSRIQRIAEQSLHMVLTNPNHEIMVAE